MFTVEQAWDYLIESGIATEQTLQVASSLEGYSLDTMQGVLYVLTGCRSFDQLEVEDEPDSIR